ncbi:hypothetical protein Lepto7376_4074 [[Leptolyngbya] sp. PCC 7376]|uniref:hypothetical protein n=1 Tax=[Leptolyngbya] sp. PCC 7376 TaxID=111781 RepID=UPI00029F1A0D|nr:hypothetical protein [[Leptolyngbya] sp. PCC 7376]AFY40204.1 hypothetical protein Lepto7376_4074 [[Leptolyngbya] sp. PCC 7376]
MWKKLLVRQPFVLTKISNVVLGVSLCALGLMPLRAQANTNFDSQSISFNKNTIVEFEFVQSHGSYRTVFGMINQTTGTKTVIFQENQPYDDYQFAEYAPNPMQHDTGSNKDYVGTFGKTVTPGIGINAVKTFGKPDGQVVEVPFQANHQYVFFLDVYDEQGNFVNQFLSTQNAANFDGNLQGGQGRDSYSRSITGISLLWEDGGRRESVEDFDYDDFVVEAGGFLFDPCPDVN